MSRRNLVVCLFVFVVLVDQALKIWVKTNMSYGEEFSILGQDWALIHFVENNGMAFGLGVGGASGKLILSLFRITAVVAIGVYLLKLLKSKAPRLLLVGFTLIVAGAWGNILDSAFYGLIFSASEFHGGPATLFPAEGGYAPFLHGRVVDMFYFPLIHGTWPDFVPRVGGSRFLFFSAIFNVADVAISAGVSLLLYAFFFGGRPVAALVGQEEE